MAVDLKGKAVIVTGAGHGLGRAYAHEAARLAAHVVVINAGVYHEAAAWDEDAARAERAVRVNVLGGILCLAAAARVMAAARDGSIVVASSAGALGSRGIMTYAATKGALASLSYAAALDLHQHGVRVNAIAPVALTRMTDGAVGGRIVPHGSDRPLLDASSMRTPERVAPLVGYLLSDAAAGITGQSLRFDGRRLGILPQP